MSEALLKESMIRVVSTENIPRVSSEVVSFISPPSHKCSGCFPFMSKMKKHRREDDAEYQFSYSITVLNQFLATCLSEINIYLVSFGHGAIHYSLHFYVDKRFAIGLPQVIIKFVGFLFSIIIVCNLGR